MFILGVMSLFLVVIHLGFASATALASAMIPIVIAVLQSVATPGINIVGMTMLLQFVVSFGFILVVNAPQNMVAYGTETFEAKDFVRTGLVLTVIALGAGHAARRDLVALARLRLSAGGNRNFPERRDDLPGNLLSFRSHPATERQRHVENHACDPCAQEAWLRLQAAHLCLRFQRRKHRAAGRRGARRRPEPRAEDPDGRGRRQAGLRGGAGGLRSQHEEARGGVRRQGGEHDAPGRCRAADRLSCRRHQPVRAEEARAGGDRTGGAEPSDRVRQWRAARIADRNRPQ